MESSYSPATCFELERAFRETGVLRPLRLERYEPGTELTYEARTVCPAEAVRIALRVESFVGGGFAGQVYRVTLTGVEGADPAPGELRPGGVYAMKILVPPRRGAKAFRDALYKIGFQGPFQLQANPAAARAGALWQKLIRRAAGIRFGDENTVADIFATFVDPVLGSCGELLEWVEGRTWLLEVDDNLTALRRWCRGKPVDEKRLGSPEYRAKRKFMARFVELLHEVGAWELARQYEWWTCKSQPNCLKRKGTENDPEAGLTAVDFRAGLVLLPFLPMSPADIPLILKGIRRGSLVQFDRGDPGKLESFVETHADRFEDLKGALEELKAVEKKYRDSVPDVTHNHVRLVTSPALWKTILRSAVTGWKVRNVIDDRFREKAERSRLRVLLFAAAGLVPLLSLLAGTALVARGWSESGFSFSLLGSGVLVWLAGSFLGRFARKVWGRSDLRSHYLKALTRLEYFKRTLRAVWAERLIRWLRAGRVNDERARRLLEHPLRALCHLPFSLLPASLHRFFTDSRFAREKLSQVFVRPVRLYFNAEAREEWLREMVSEGKRKHILSDEDADTILSQIKEPFIQKYLKSLAVHICTLPVTQLVALAVAVYGIVRFDMTWSQAWPFALGVFVFFQATPISPGSLTRGLYVVYLVLRERNIKDYNIAVWLGFFKYIGYLAFPIQMTYRYPALARFMAAHWATDVVHIVPVFGERGALLEHAVFGLFYNWPLTVRRRMEARARVRRLLPERTWHAVPAAVGAAALFAAVEYLFWSITGEDPRLKNVWPAALLIPLLTGSAVTLGAGGASLGRRVMTALYTGVGAAVLYGVLHTLLGSLVFRAGSVAVGFVEGLLSGSLLSALIPAAGIFAVAFAWALFFFSILTPVGTLLTEVFLPEVQQSEGSGESEREREVEGAARS